MEDSLVQDCSLLLLVQLQLVSWPGQLLAFLICVPIPVQYLWVYFWQMVSQWCLLSNHSFVIKCILFMVMYISILDSCAGVCLRDQICFSCTGASQKLNTEDVLMRRMLHFIWFPLNVYSNKKEEYSCFCMLKSANLAKMEEKVGGSCVLLYNLICVCVSCACLLRKEKQRWKWVNSLGSF